MSPLERLQNEIENTVSKVVMEERAQLLGDWAFVASTLGTGADDPGSYITISSDSPTHSRIGLVEILRSDVAMLGYAQEDNDE